MAHCGSTAQAQGRGCPACTYTSRADGPCTQQRQGPTKTARVRPPWTEPSPKRAFRALLACSSRTVRCLLGERLGLLLLELGLAWRLRAALPALPALPGVRPRLLLHRGYLIVQRRPKMEFVGCCAGLDCRAQEPYRGHGSYGELLCPVCGWWCCSVNTRAGGACWTACSSSQGCRDQNPAYSSVHATRRPHLPAAESLRACTQSGKSSRLAPAGPTAHAPAASPG